MKAAQTFSNSADPDTGALRLDLRQALRRNALALVAYFDPNTRLSTNYSNAGAFALRVTVDIG